jgi:hypothetical protein
VQAAVDDAQARATEAHSAVEELRHARSRPEGKGASPPRLGWLAGAIAFRRPKISGGWMATESRAARPLGEAPSGMARVVGVANRCRPDRREPHRRRRFSKGLGARTEGPPCDAELARHTQDAQGAAEGPAGIR